VENQKNNKGVIALLIVIIIILSALCVLFATGTISFKSNDVDNNEINQDVNENNNKNDLENNNSNISNDDKVENDIVVDYKLESKTNIKVDLMWDEKYDNIEIINGNLKVNDKIFSIKNEKIRYFYMQRYQSSASTVFHYLTEKGNIYVTEFTYESTTDSFNNFIKLNYSNVTDIVVLPNDHYGKTFDDVSGIIDNRESYLYAVINGEKSKLDYQYNY